MTFAPVDVAYVRRSGGSAQDASIATLGRVADGEGVLLLRFAAQVPPEANVLEAYLLLERATDVDADPVAITLHAERILDVWDSATVSWARAPRLRELVRGPGTAAGMGAPRTRVGPTSGPLVRLEVREFVQRWRRRGSRDFGVAVVTEGRSVTGLPVVSKTTAASGFHRDPAVALFSAAIEPSSPFDARFSQSSVAEPRAQFAGPRLELYVR